jgi:hypothetical protein
MPTRPPLVPPCLLCTVGTVRRRSRGFGRGPTDRLGGPARCDYGSALRWSSRPREGRAGPSRIFRWSSTPREGRAGPSRIFRWSSRPREGRAGPSRDLRADLGNVAVSAARSRYAGLDTLAGARYSTSEIAPPSLRATRPARCFRHPAQLRRPDDVEAVVPVNALHNPWRQRDHVPASVARGAGRTRASGTGGSRLTVIRGGLTPSGAGTVLIGAQQAAQCSFRRSPGTCTGGWPPGRRRCRRQTSTDQVREQPRGWTTRPRREAVSSRRRSPGFRDVRRRASSRLHLLRSP